MILRAVAVVVLGIVACSHGAYSPGLKWKPSHGDNEGRGTFDLYKSVPLQHLELALLRVTGRPITDECALVFTSCGDGGPEPHQFLVTTTPEPQRGCFVPYCGEQTGILLKISWGRDVPQIAIWEKEVGVFGLEGDYREPTIEAAIARLTSGKGKGKGKGKKSPGLVILSERCGDPVGPMLRAIALLNQAKMRVLVTALRIADQSCEDPRYPNPEKGELE